MKPLYFLHGLEGSPQGTKGQFLSQRFTQLIAPFMSPDLNQRLELLRSVITEPAVLIGSSLGGLTALTLANESPELVLGMVLVAPVVGLYEDEDLSAEQKERVGALVVPAGIPTWILAAKRDHLIPPESIQDLVQRSPDRSQIHLDFFDDDHSMNAHLEELAQAVTALLQRLA
ncbi:MAG: alpha/beta fold hydrolase [bacterium]|nr:alpha/beta fold hydrolase [bacterium]